MVRISAKIWIRLEQWAKEKGRVLMWTDRPAYQAFCGVTDTWCGISFSQHSWCDGMLSLLDRWINWNTECLSYLPWVTAHLRKTKSSCDWNHGVPDYTVGVLSSFLFVPEYILPFLLHRRWGPMSFNTYTLCQFQTSRLKNPLVFWGKKKFQ